MSDFSELNEYLMPVMVDVRRDRIVETCQRLAAAGLTQVQPDVDRLLNMSNDGEAPDVIDDLHKIIFDHLYTTTLNLGFIWSEDVDWTTDFNLLSDVLKALILLDDVEDYGELNHIFNDDLLSTEEKVMEVLQVTLAKDMSILLERVDTITEETVVGLMTSVNNIFPDEDEQPAQDIGYVTERLAKYQPKMYQGVAYAYIALGGGVGVDYGSLLQLFNNELARAAEEDLTVLTQELIGFALASTIIDDMLQDEVCKQLDIYVDDKLRLQDLGAIVTGFFA